MKEADQGVKVNNYIVIRPLQTLEVNVRAQLEMSVVTQNLFTYLEIELRC